MQARYCLGRYETVVAQVTGHKDAYVSILESRLCQSSVGPFKEKTRLAAVTNWSNTHRSTSAQLAYEPFKSVVLQVCGGERVQFTRRTLHSLSQKACGSFDQYLADFETQAAHILPSASEKLEVFMAGLNTGLRNRVLCRADNTDWPGWTEFLIVCKRFADADLRSRDIPAKGLRGPDNCDHNHCQALFRQH